MWVASGHIFRHLQKKNENICHFLLFFERHIPSCFHGSVRETDSSHIWFALGELHNLHHWGFCSNIHILWACSWGQLPSGRGHFPPVHHLVEQYPCWYFPVHSHGSFCGNQLDKLVIAGIIDCDHPHHGSVQGELFQTGHWHQSSWETSPTGSALLTRACDTAPSVWLVVVVSFWTGTYFRVSSKKEWYILWSLKTKTDFCCAMRCLWRQIFNLLKNVNWLTTGHFVIVSGTFLFMDLI